MVDKLKKHGTLLIRRMNQAREVNRMKKCPDETVQIILEAFQAVRTGAYGPEDRKVFDRCESYRDALKKRGDKISFKIFGIDRDQTVGEICQKAATPEIWCIFLYLLAKKLASENLLEVGTNLGVSGSYLLEAIAGNPNSKLTTMEGVSQLCAISAQRFSEIAHHNQFEVIEGLYQDTFPKVLERPGLFDLVFIDGNHQEGATLDYFSKLKQKADRRTVFVFDDINWSKGMKAAWKTIQNDGGVSFSIDLWKQGIVVLNPLSQKKGSFRLFLDY